MRIQHLGHSCVLVEACEQRVLIDPGNFSTAWHDVDELDAILVTHRHPDHADPERLPKLVADHPDALVAVEASVVDEIELPAAARKVQAGDEFEIGQLSVQVIGGEHAVIHADIPRIANVGFIICSPGQPTIFHPGDALDVTPDGVDFVCIPLQAPWSATKEVIDFTRAVGAPRGMLIHDGLLNHQGYQTVSKHVVNLGGTEILDLRDGAPVEL